MSDKDDTSVRDDIISEAGHIIADEIDDDVGSVQS